jgi:phosphatidylserine synthase
MRKWDGAIFKNNHLRLMMWHIFFALFWFLIPVVVMIKIQSKGSAGMLIPIAISFLPTLMHGVLSYGSYKKIEISRKISEFIFGMMLLAFPVGTFLSMYLILPTLQWKNPEENNHEASS